MSIHCQGKAKLLIPETGEVFEVNSDDLYWEIVETDEKSMGTEWYYCASVYFSSDEEDYEIEAEWSVWEYPIGAIENTDTKVKGGKLHFSKVQQDIVTRHDLVHRNGKNKKGKEIIVDELMVNEVIDRIDNFISEIDRKLHSKKHLSKKNKSF